MLDESISLVADAYYAVLTSEARGLVIQAVTSISAIIHDEQDVLKVANTINQQIGQTDDKELRQVFVALHRQFERRMCESEIARLHTLFSQDSEAGWTAWLQAYANALLSWPLRLAQMLIVEDFPFPEHTQADVAKVKRLVRYIIRERYEEGFDIMLYLARQEVLKREERASLYVLAAEIQMYRFTQWEEGRRLVEIAEELAPDEAMVKCGWGAYWLQKYNPLKAKDFLQEAMRLDPQTVESYNLMGDCYDQQNDFDAAEAWYREGTKQRSGDMASSGYLRLINLYGRTEKLFQAHEADLVSLLERAIAVSPMDEYVGYLTLSSVYLQNKHYEKAHYWCGKAIALDETRLEGYISRGMIYSEEQHYEEAEADFKKAIEVDREIFDGYWNLGYFYEQRERWQDALAQYRQCLALRMVWEYSIRARIGEMLWNLQHYTEAEEELLRALKCKVDEQSTVDTLEIWAGNYYTKLNQFDKAQHLYTAIREIKGSSYEPGYQNRIGNMHYYRGEYEQALSYYQKAVEADSHDADYHSNLALAWERVNLPNQKLMALENAASELHAALELNPKDSGYAERLAGIEVRRKLVQQFGEFIFNLVPEGVSIGVELGEALIAPFFQTSGIPLEVQGIVDAMRSRFFEVYGVKLPGVNFKDNLDLERGGYVLKVPGLNNITGRVSPGKRYFPGKQEDLAALGIGAEMLDDEQAGTKDCWVAQADWQKVEESGLQLWMEMEYPLRHLESVLRRNATILIDHRQIDVLLSEKKVAVYPEFKNVPTRLSTFVQSLSALVYEGVSISPLEQMANAFLEKERAEKDLLTITEQLRSLPDVLPILPGNNASSSFYRLNQQFEEELNALIYETGYGPVLAMNTKSYVTMLSTIVESVSNEQDMALLVVNNYLRPFLRVMFDMVRVAIPLLSLNELLPALREKAVKEIQLPLPANDGTTGGAHGENEEKRFWPQAQRQQSHQESEEGGASPKPERDGRHTGELLGTILSPQDEEPLTVFLSSQLYHALGESHGSNGRQTSASPLDVNASVQTLWSTFQVSFYQERGVILPLLCFEIDEQLQGNEARIHVCDEQLSLSLPMQEVKQASDNGTERETTALIEQVVVAISHFIDEHISIFLTVRGVQCSLFVLRNSFPALVDSILIRFDIAVLTQCLKDILDKKLWIMDLRSILEALMSLNGTIQVDPEQHVLCSFTPLSTLSEEQTLVFLPHSLKFVPTLSAKTLDELDGHDYSNYLLHLY